jgi:hypothetical protein
LQAAAAEAAVVATEAAMQPGFPLLNLQGLRECLNELCGTNLVAAAQLLPARLER